MAHGRSRLNSLRSLTSRRQTSPRPPSPTFSETTHVSAMNFGPNGPEKIITRANLKVSLQAYEDLVNSCASYRAALISMAKATAAFADAMAVCSSLKGPTYEAGTRLQVASGLHHLIGNQWHVLAEALDKKFEKPLRQHLDAYRTVVAERSANYERALWEKSQVIRDTELRNMNRRERNLQSFREALAVLQRQVDDLDDLKVAHYQEIMEHEEEVWGVVQGKACFVVRSTLDVFDRVTAKASDPIIEPMLQTVPDPFDSYGPPQSEDQIFSILPPLSILTNPPSASPSPLTATPEPEAFRGLPASNPTWIPDNKFTFPSREGAEWAESPSASSTSPRSLSPPSISPPHLHRRHSTPPITGSHSRKSESKLRSVLSVIDESRSRQENEDLTNAPLLPAKNGLIAASESSWKSLPESPPHTPNDDGENTPRHSMILSSETPPPPDKDMDTEKSPDTIHVPLPS